MQIFDTHAHYFDAKFESLGAHYADGLLREIMPDPITHIINVGTNCKNSQKAIAQAREYEGMYAAVGIHPGDCHYLSDVEAALVELRELLGDDEARRRNKIVALGEIGLDYHWQEYDGIPMDKQKQAYFLERQLEMAEEMDLPVIIHDREAHGDCFETVLRYPRVRGVFHSYSGSAEMARELVRHGWYISFSGTLTFKNANRVREAALAVPRDRLLIETDAPYLAPHPMRGSLNHSGLMRYTVDTLAQIWSCSPDEAAKITFENAKKLFLSDTIG
ncbi:MAG: TatD family hydrolase [Clostridia bacterium]|nr:TatD family hydrolase [Clostridia bacterium]